MTIHYGVAPEKVEKLKERMTALGLREEDFEETFMRSQGKGGQKVNKTSSCVRLVHKPSGFEVKMQQERSQALNRYRARQRMCELMESKTLGDDSPEARERARIAKQKSRRKRRASKKN
jgi:peptide chain release factor